jgi:integrase
VKLTEDRILKLEGVAGRKDFLVKDDARRGLFVRVSEAARSASLDGKNYLAKYTLAGVRHKIPLGACSGLTLAKARSAAATILGDLAKGLDPAGDRKAAAQEAQRKAAHEALTLNALLDQWSALRLADKRESYAAEAVRAIKVAFPKQLPLPAADLDRATVVRVLDNMTKDGKPAMAARTAAYGRACYQWAMRRGSLSTNPFANLPVAPTVKRDRVLSDPELRAIWQATAKPGSFNLIVRTLMLTAQRRDEVAEMAWPELSDDFQVWTIPASRAKNGQDSVVPLSPQAKAIIEAAPRYEGNPLVFPGERGAYSGWSQSKKRLDQRCGVKDWVLHDLRRAAATNLQKLGVRLEVTEAVLNHVSGSRGGIVRVYQRHEYSTEKRVALTAWADRLEQIVEGGEPAEKIVDLSSRRIPAA